MDTRTGKLYANYAEAVQELELQKIEKEEIESRLMALNETEYKELSGMNRAEKRRWAREQKKNRKR